RRLDLHLDGGQAALDDLDEDRVGTRPGVGGQGVERELGGGKPRGGHESAPSRVTMMLRYSSMRTTNPGWTGTVEPNSSMMVGPASRVPGTRSSRQKTGVSTRPRPGSKQTCRWDVGAGCGSACSGSGVSSGRWIGPMPETRRLTHSTCWSGFPSKS